MSTASTTPGTIPLPTVAPAKFIRGRADVAKLAVSGFMFVAVLAATLLPAIFVRRFRSSETSSPSRRRRLFRQGISCLNCFAGGVFLATGILDVLPDAIDEIKQSYAAMKIQMDFPLAHFCLLVGFFILLTVEQIVACCAHQHPHSHLSERTPLLVDTNAGGARARNWRSHSLTASMEGISSPDSAASDASSPWQRRRARHKWQSRDPVSGPSSPEAMTSANQFDRSSMALMEDDEDGVDHFVEAIAAAGSSPIRSMFLIGAMSVHSLFEGLALGLEESAQSVYQLLLAICLHKFVLALAIGLSLGQTRLVSIKLLTGGSIVFAIASPIGAVMGMSLRYAASLQGPAGLAHFQLASGILQGTACGTFIFVTFFEILPREINEATQPRQRALYMTFLLIGFGLMCTLIYVL